METKYHKRQKKEGFFHKILHFLVRICAFHPTKQDIMVEEEDLEPINKEGDVPYASSVITIQVEEYDVDKSRNFNKRKTYSHGDYKDDLYEENGRRPWRPIKRSTSDIDLISDAFIRERKESFGTL